MSRINEIDERLLAIRGILDTADSDTMDKLELEIEDLFEERKRITPVKPTPLFDATFKRAPIKKLTVKRSAEQPTNGNINYDVSNGGTITASSHMAKIPIIDDIMEQLVNSYL